jgi:small subunit ribosomal protein S6
MVKYEAMFILNPDLSEEEKKNLFNQIKDTVSKNNGSVLQASVWQERRKLCYPIKKHQEGLYYLMDFSTAADSLKEINQAYKLNEHILRVLITRRE